MESPSSINLDTASFVEKTFWLNVLRAYLSEKMLEKGHQKVKGNSGRFLKKSRILLGVFNLDGIDHLKKTFPKNFINLLLIP